MTRIKSINDMMSMLDILFRTPAPWWNKFYQDKTKQVPFFKLYPDENLVSYFDSKCMERGKVLELGCGNGRNAIYMTELGCKVDAVDISEEAITWAKENAASRNVEVNFICDNVLNLDFTENAYDFIYDCGLLHHLVPHQRMQYIELINRVLKSGGSFGVVCYAPEFEEITGIPNRTDESIYKSYSMQGGIAYTKDDLRDILLDYFNEVEIRNMKECRDEDKLFGKEFLWASLWRKKS
ncbi:class I SAM-dependent methyltransferase [Paenibacillus sp. GCM10023252]|uniref:class I SAM-dependent methyltransferase n=1 Tax=Paenibacillus sp. GCM10023252 TaxID=3252649 RepID=UPI003619E8AF